GLLSGISNQTCELSRGKNHMNREFSRQNPDIEDPVTGGGSDPSIDGPQDPDVDPQPVPPDQGPPSPIEEPPDQPGIDDNQPDPPQSAIRNQMSLPGLYKSRDLSKK